MVEAKGSKGDASTLGQPATTILNPESGRINNSARNHPRNSAGLTVCGGLGSVPAKNSEGRP